MSENVITENVESPKFIMNKKKQNKPKLNPEKKRRINQQFNKHIESLHYDLYVSRHKKEMNKVKAINMMIRDLRKKKRNLN